MSTPDPLSVEAALGRAAEEGSPARGAALGLCASCACGVITVLREEREDGDEWRAGRLVTYARCLHPGTPMAAVAWPVVACDGYTRRVQSSHVP
jgi:hypothetical protein